MQLAGRLGSTFGIDPRKILTMSSIDRALLTAAHNVVMADEDKRWNS